MRGATNKEGWRWGGLGPGRRAERADDADDPGDLRAPLGVERHN